MHSGASGALLPALGDALWTVAAVAAPRDLCRLAHVSPAVNALLSPVAERTARISELTSSLTRLPVQFAFPLASLGQKWLEEALAQFSALKLLRWREKAGQLAGWVPTEEDHWPAFHSRAALLSAIAAIQLAATSSSSNLLFAAVLRLQQMQQGVESEVGRPEELKTAPLAFEWADGPAADPLQMALQLSFIEEDVVLNLEMISGTSPLKQNFQCMPCISRSLRWLVGLVRQLVYEIWYPGSCCNFGAYAARREPSSVRIYCCSGCALR